MEISKKWLMFGMFIFLALFVTFLVLYLNEQSKNNKVIEEQEKVKEKEEEKEENENHKLLSETEYLTNWWNSLDQVTKDVEKGTFIICSSHCTHYKWIELQKRSIERFIKVPYKFIVVNDAPEGSEYEHKISEFCRNNDVQCVRLPQALHRNRTIVFPDTLEPSQENASAMAAIAVQTCYEILKHHGGIGLIFDADAMFTKDFYPREYIGDYWVMAPEQCKGSKEKGSYFYLWTPFMLFNFDVMKEQDLFSMDCGRVNDVPVDTGGQSYWYWSRYKDNMLIIYEKGVDDERLLEYKKNVNECVQYFEVFLHDRFASNWGAQSEEEFLNKITHLAKLIDYIVNK